MQYLKNTLTIAGVYIATVIGAGFASGQEILSFFVVYGTKSVYGLLIVMAMFAICGALVMYRVYNDRLNSFREYMTCISSRKMCTFIEICTVLFMITGFCSMSAGSGVLLSSLFGWHMLVGVILMLVMSGIVFLFDLKGILTVNGILAPVLCIGLIALGISAFVSRGVPVFAGGISSVSGITRNWVVSAIIYAAYNLLTGVVILSETRPLLKKPGIAVWSGVIGGVSLGIIALVIWGVIKLYYGKVELGELPFLEIVARQGRIVEIIYSVILYIAMFTTSVSCGYGFLGRLKETFGIKNITGVLILTLITIPISLMGFSGIIQNLYSAFGYLGLPLVAVVLWDGIRMIRERRFK